MPLIHNGADFWNTLEQQGPDPLGRYFADAAERRDSLTAPAESALQNWPRVLDPVDDDAMDPWRPSCRNAVSLAQVHRQVTLFPVRDSALSASLTRCCIVGRS